MHPDPVPAPGGPGTRPSPVTSTPLFMLESGLEPTSLWWTYGFWSKVAHFWAKMAHSVFGGQALAAVLDHKYWVILPNFLICLISGKICVYSRGFSSEGGGGPPPPKNGHPKLDLVRVLTRPSPRGRAPPPPPLGVRERRERIGMKKLGRKTPSDGQKGWGTPH